MGATGVPGAVGGTGITMFPSSCSVWSAATPGGGQRATAGPPEACPPEGVGGPAASLWGPLLPVLAAPPSGQHPGLGVDVQALGVPAGGSQVMS